MKSPMGQRLLGAVEGLCAQPFALTLALSRGERGGERFLPFVETFALCHSRVGGNLVFAKFMPAHGIGDFRAHTGMPAFRGTGALARMDCLDSRLHGNDDLVEG